jgi:hypothetical protein
MDSTDVAHNMGNWWVFVNAVMNLRVLEDAGNFLSR